MSQKNKINHKSIGQRIHHIDGRQLSDIEKKSLKLEILIDWATRWEKEYLAAILKIEEAVETDDQLQVINSLEFLFALQKKFIALHNIFKNLLTLTEGKPL